MKEKETKSEEQGSEDRLKHIRKVGIIGFGQPHTQGHEALTPRFNQSYVRDEVITSNIIANDFGARGTDDKSTLASKIAQHLLRTQTMMVEDRANDLEITEADSVVMKNALAFGINDPKPFCIVTAGDSELERAIIERAEKALGSIEVVTLKGETDEDNANELKELYDSDKFEKIIVMGAAAHAGVMFLGHVDHEIHGVGPIPSEYAQRLEESHIKLKKQVDYDVSNIKFADQKQPNGVYIPKHQQPRGKHKRTW